MDIFRYIKLGVENPKAVISLWLFILSLTGGNVFGWVQVNSQSKEADSYKQGYEALAVNVQTSLSTKPAKLDNIKPCNCQHLINLHVKQAH